LLAILSLALSAIPHLAFWLGTASIVLYAWLGSRRLGRAPAQVLRIADDGSWAVLLSAGAPPRLFSEVRLGVRGPMAWLRVRGGKDPAFQWNWWPDTLPLESRRQLRLAMKGPIGTSAPALATMAG